MPPTSARRASAPSPLPSPRTTGVSTSAWTMCAPNLGSTSAPLPSRRSALGAKTPAARSEREALDFDTRPTASWTASHIRALSEQLIGVALAKGPSDQLRSGNRRRVGNKHQAAHRGPAYLPCEYAMGPSLSQDPMAYHPCGSNIDGHEDDMWQAPFDGDDHDNLSPSPSLALVLLITTTSTPTAASLPRSFGA